jgi:hypothetical protein
MAFHFNSRPDAPKTEPSMTNGSRCGKKGAPGKKSDLFISIGFPPQPPVGLLDEFGRLQLRPEKTRRFFHPASPLARFAVRHAPPICAR